MSLFVVHPVSLWAPFCVVRSFIHASTSIFFHHRLGFTRAFTAPDIPDGESLASYQARSSVDSKGLPLLVRTQPKRPASSAMNRSSSTLGIRTRRDPDNAHVCILFLRREFARNFPTASHSLHSSFTSSLHSRRNGNLISIFIVPLDLSGLCTLKLHT